MRQRYEVSEDLNQKLPEEVDQLEAISKSIRKCPNCQTYYYYTEFDVSSDPYDVIIRSYKRLHRLTFSHIKDFFLQLATDEEDKVRLLEEWKDFQERYEQIIRDMISVITTKSKTINWHIKKYIIEFLTDHFLFEEDWKSFQEILLKNSNSAVRVDSAYELLLIATESKLGKRYFTKELQEMAKVLLFKKKEERCLKLVKLFTETLFDESTTYEISVPGYNKIPVSHKAYSGLVSASYRGFDITIAVPSLIKWLAGEDKWKNQEANYLLKELLKRNDVYGPLIREEIYKIENRSKEMSNLLRKCKKN